MTPSEIAIVGAACRVPGANHYEALWTNLQTSVDAITRSTPTRSDDRVYAEGLVGGTDLFDAEYFRISPGEARLIDPQQRLLLEVCAEALCDAGYERGDGLGDVGVVASVGENRYLVDNLLRSPDIVSDHGQLRLLLGNEKDHAATRVANRLDLHGPALAIQTSCSSSLVGVHLAVRLLRADDADAVVVGAASLKPVDARPGYDYEEGGILSPDGWCRAFSSRANGTVPGYGGVALVLRRLEDAVADGSPIHAVVKGSAANNDGAAKLGYTAPSTPGQRRVLAAGLRNAGIDPADVDYIVAHGTGTVLGDAVELEAILDVYGGERDEPVTVGSVKPNVGHLDSASGVLNALVGALSVARRSAPPSLYQDGPTTLLSKGLVGLAHNGRPLSSDGLVAVSAFGLGGTNAHVILAPPPVQHSHDLSVETPLILVVSGRSEATSKEYQGRVAAVLTRDARRVDLAGLATTLAHGRRQEDWRGYTILGTSDREVVDVVPPRRRPASAGFGLVFSGLGRRLSGVFGGLAGSDPLVAETLREVLEATDPEDVPILKRELMSPAPNEVSLKVEQLATFAIQLVVARLLMSRTGTKPAMVTGHSLGEYAAATIAGSMSVSTAVALVSARAEALERSDPGAMISMRLAEDEVRALLPDKLDVAAVNSPAETVVSGAVEDIRLFEEELARRRPSLEYKRLSVRAAAHSRLLDAELASFRATAQMFEFNPPMLSWISTVDAVPVTDAPNALYWTRQLRSSVRFADAVVALRDGSVPLIEIGAGYALTRSLAACAYPLRVLPVFPAEPRDALADVARCLGEMWSDGLSVDFVGVALPASGQRMHAPTPPFVREKHWVAGGAGAEPAAAEFPTPAAPFVGPRLDDASLRDGLAGLWALLTGTPVEDGAADFFAVGGDSALLIQLRRKIQETWSVQLSFKELMLHSTFDDMVERIAISL